MKARIPDGLRVDSFIVSDKLTLTTQKWTTVTKKQAAAMVGLRYKGAPLVEFDEAVVDEPVVEDFPVTADDADQEDESNGTQ